MKISLIIISIFCAASLFAAAPHPDNVVVPLSAASQVLIPVAGSTPGGFGTFFRSDITIINFASHDQQVRLQWLPQGGTPVSTTITITAQNGIRSSDFVTDYLKQSGLGAIIVSGVTSSGAVDNSALLYASSRIWTNQPGSNGTMSQSLPAVPMNALFPMSTAGFFAVGGADNPANYRTNVGIVNTDPTTTQTFTILVPIAVPSGGTTGNAFLVTLPPMSMAQVAVGTGLSPTQQIIVRNTTPGILLPNPNWIAYVSNVDNISGDAWSELAVPGQ